MTADGGQADTIVALSSGAGRAGVAVLRVSGPRAMAALTALIKGPAPRPRFAALRRLRDPGDASPIDDALVLRFPGPHSFTGEDVVELHVHGGRAVIARAIEALTALPGLRLAEPGEFSRRAFENGRLDLTAAEGLADLIDAETEGQRRQALRQAEGGLARLYEGWRHRLLRTLALLEAEIDFPDEDLPTGLGHLTGPEINALLVDLDAHLADGARGERVREGYRVAIVGAPNAGKSSLLNALARREAAIVSDIPGTTRDVIEVRIVLEGFPVWIADTAGLREAADAIEAEGVRRALARAEEADLRLGVVDGAGATIDAATLAALRDDDLLVVTKADLADGLAAIEALSAAQGRDLAKLSVSTRTGQGVDALERAIAARVVTALAGDVSPVITRARHRALVGEARAHLTRALGAQRRGAELAAEDVRLAARALGRITGRIDVEDVLGEIFSNFCIGK